MDCNFTGVRPPDHLLCAMRSSEEDKIATFVPPASAEFQGTVDIIMVVMVTVSGSEAASIVVPKS